MSCYAPELVGEPNCGKTLVQTPHLDSLAKEGARLTSFFTNSAVCTPSRGCLFTGRYPHAHGAYRNDTPMNRDEQTIARVLQGHGYDTGHAGKWHLDGPPKPKASFTRLLTTPPGNDRTKQTGPLKRTAVRGEEGKKEHVLDTGEFANSALILGIYRQGSLSVRNLRIERLD